MDTGDEQQVLAAATRAAGGDASRAQTWYHQEKLAVLSGKTPAQLVAEGRAAAVLRYIDMMEQGPAG